MRLICRHRTSGLKWSLLYKGPPRVQHSNEEVELGAAAYLNGTDDLPHDSSFTHRQHIETNARAPVTIITYQQLGTVRSYGGGRAIEPAHVASQALFLSIFLLLV